MNCTKSFYVVCNSIVFCYLRGECPTMGEDQELDFGSDHVIMTFYGFRNWKITWLNPQLDLTVDDMIFAILVTYEWLVFHLVIYHWFYPRTRSKINNFVLSPVPGLKCFGPLWTKKWENDDLMPESGSFLNWLSMLDSFFLAQQPGPTLELLTLELLSISPDRLK